MSGYILEDEVVKVGEGVPITSFYGSQDLKQEILDRIAAHGEADTIAQGHGYWMPGEDGVWRGCAIGCSIMDVGRGVRPYEEYAGRFPAWYNTIQICQAVLGIYGGLLDVEEEIFEMLPGPIARFWPRRFTEALPVGVDLSHFGYEYLDGVVHHGAQVLSEKLLSDLRAVPDAGSWETRSAFDYA